jgi:O-antigen ligase
MSRVRARAAQWGCAAYLVTFALPLNGDLPLIALAVAVLAAGPTAIRNLRGARWAMLVALAVIGITSLASIAVSLDPARSGVGAAATLPALLLGGTICYRFSQSDGLGLLPALVALALVVQGSALVGFAIDASGDPSRWIGKYSKVMAVPNDTIILSVLWPLMLVALLRASSGVEAAASLVAMVLGVVVIVLARSRLGVVTLLVGAMLTLVLLEKRRLIWSVLALALLSVAVDALVGFPLAKKALGATGESRVALWWAAWTMFLSAPLWGHGANMFGVLYPSLTAAFPLQSPYLRVDTFYVPWAHNLFLEILAERGIVAFAAFVTALAVAMVSARRALRSTKRDLAAGLLGSMACLIVAGAAEVSLLHLWVPVVCFAVFGMAATLHNNEDSS